MAVFVGGSFFVVNRAINAFTSTQPVQIQVRQATPAERQVAKAKLDTLRSAARNHQETTIEFNADEINALIANEPEFRGARGHVRVAIANSIASLDVSAPLDSMHWKRLKGRWFNGNIQFGFSYVDDNFNFDIRSAEANGYQFPRAILTSDVVCNHSIAVLTKAFIGNRPSTPTPTIFGGTSKWRRCKVTNWS